MTADEHPGDTPERPDDEELEPQASMDGADTVSDRPDDETVALPDDVAAEGEWPQTESGYAPPPPPPPAAAYPAAAGAPTPASAIPADSRNWAMAAHLSAIVGAFVALAFVGPLVVWLVKKDEDAFVAHHAKEALNFNLSLLIYAVAAVILTVVTIGIGAIVTIPLAAIAFVAWIVLTIIAAVKGSNGEGYRYPLTLRLIN